MMYIMNPNNKLPIFKPQASLSDKSLWDLIQLATEKQIFWILSRIWLTEEQKQKLENVSIWKFVQSLSYPQEANFRESLRSILSIDGLEKSRTVTINNREYTRTVSEIFATDGDFKNFVEPDNNFKQWLNDIWASNIKYIIGKDILDSDSKKNLKLNWKIIKKIVSEYYNDDWLWFIKDLELLQLNWDKIAKSELTSCNSIIWCNWELGICGYLWLRAINEQGDLICIQFEEELADLIWIISKSDAMRVISQK